MTVIHPDLPRPARKAHMHRRIAALQHALEALTGITDAYGDGHLVEPADSARLEERITRASALLDGAAASFAGALAALQPCLPAASTPCACPACRQAARNLDSALDALQDLHHDH